jgi:hypothetical protein
MRHYFPALLGAWLALAGSPGTCNTSLAQSVADEEWAHGGLAEPRRGGETRSAADAYDDSVWIATDDSLLLHFSHDGLLLQGTTLQAPGGSVAVDLDQTVWVLVDRQLQHFDRDAARLETREPPISAGERGTELAIDPLRGRLWMATTRRILGVAAGASALEPPVDVIHGEVTALALDPRSGRLLAIVDGSLLAIDGAPASPQALDAVPLGTERPLALAYDADDRTFVVRTARSILRVTPDARIVERRLATEDEVIVATPFRIDPTLALLRPPDGAAVASPHAEIVLRAGARCNWRPCDTPDGYFRGLRVEARLDDVPMGDPVVEYTTGRITFPQRPPLRPGVNRVTARVTDRFGHHAILEEAQLSLLESVADGLEAPSARESARTSSERPMTKAANKPPVVSLTAPANGTTFPAGASVELAAAATDPDGSIAKIEFYRGGSTLLGTTTTAPYRYVWSGTAAGSYSLTAKAYDNRNGTAISAPAAITVTTNQLPVVAMAEPVADAFFVAGSSISLSAAATDPDGTIASVEFLDGTTSIGRATLPPFAVTWSAPSPGIHSLAARAVDDLGGASVSAAIEVVVGEAPVVVVAAPAACAFVEGPRDVTLAADVMSTGGRIVSVEFFDGAALVGTASADPWRVTLAAAPLGNHSITAKATDDHGVAVTSRPSVFTVTGSNQPPTVAITSPLDGARLAPGTIVGFTATAADTDGTISKVEYWMGSVGGSLIGSAASSPYAVTWAALGSGSHAFYALAYDDRGAATASMPVSVTVDANALPAVAVTAPAVDATYAAPATIALSASASDSDGAIAKVEFYAGTTLVATATAAPYAAIWTNVGAGAYAITAKATDNAGGVGVSAPIPITVASNAPPTVAVTAPAAGTQYFAPATIALSATAADSDGAIARVEFYANGALIGSSSASPYGFVWDQVAAGSYSVTAKAIDAQGGATTSSSVSVTVGAGPQINIVPSLDNATIDDDNAMIGGYVFAPGNSAVTVNGVVTRIDDYGRFQTNDVPLLPGANAVSAVVTTQDGQTSSHSITVNSTGRGPFVVHASPTEGLGSLDVTFTVENPGNASFKQMHFDLDNDGFPNVIATPDLFVGQTLTVSATYPVGTWLAVIKVFDTDDRVIYATSKSIVVLEPTLHARSLRAIYDGVLQRLRAGNIPGALTAFTGAAYDKYNAIFTQLQPSLASVVDQLGEIRELNFVADLAEFAIVRDTPEGPRQFMLYMIRAEDGIWRIDGM